MNPCHITTPPSAGFIAGVAAATGIHRADGYEIAQLFITHPGPRRLHETAQTVEDGMRSLARALDLGPGGLAPPTIGRRIVIVNGITALDYGHDQYVMTIPQPSQDWMRFVGDGAPCRICLVFAPLPLSADQAATDAHLRACFDKGGVVWGTAYARRRF
ncbi:hypothetical protein OK074_5511 [Actinobacteria bacterium OK074]|nr:hypothetical protein OK074_5511 [Actinobacteria bacterium OK074]